MVDLFLKSLDGTKQYIAQRIDSTGNRSVYLETVQHIEDWVEMCECETLYHVEAVLQSQERVQRFAQRCCYPKPWFFDRRFQYQLLAYEHAGAIASSLKKRFVTGGESDYLYLFRRGASS